LNKEPNKVRRAAQKKIAGYRGKNDRESSNTGSGLRDEISASNEAQPKEMLPVVDKPVIQYVVEEAISSGIKDILIITGRNKRAIEDHFDKGTIDNRYVLE